MRKPFKFDHFREEGCRWITLLLLFYLQCHQVCQQLGKSLIFFRVCLSRAIDSFLCVQVWDIATPFRSTFRTTVACAHLCAMHVRASAMWGLSTDRY